jgi:cytochrome c oxidase assembly protein subunit 15
MSTNRHSRSLFRFATFVALATLGLVCLGGLVTSKGVGMAVPDWPTSFGYNMFALPISTWKTGGIFDEHTHRVWASSVGLLVVVLTRWIGGPASRRPLFLVGAAELALGSALLLGAGVNWKGEGHFLLGIGGVVLAAAAVPWRNSPASATAIRMAWLAFWVVQIQGSLGGLRVVLDQWTVAGTTGGILFGILHGCLGQLFFGLLAALTVHLSPWWRPESWRRMPFPAPTLGLVATFLVLGQLMLGLLMRHQHAGLAIPDLPLAYGQLWPATDAASLARYAAARADVDSLTAFQVQIHMLHRMNALLALGAVTALFSKARNLPSGHPLRTLATVWFSLTATQFVLGVLTVLFGKPADIATAHVAVGSLSLSTGLLNSWITWTGRSAGSESLPVSIPGLIPQMTRPGRAL